MTKKRKEQITPQFLLSDLQELRDQLKTCDESEFTRRKLEIYCISQLINGYRLMVQDIEIEKLKVIHEQVINNLKR